MVSRSKLHLFPSMN